MAKLQSQIDFLNKENHRLQTQLDIHVKDNTVVDHIDQYRKQVDELTFENHTLRKDQRELTVMLKDYQEKEFNQREMDRSKEQTEKQLTSEMTQSKRLLEIAQAEMKDEKARMESTRAAYNADKRALMERIELLE